MATKRIHGAGDGGFTSLPDGALVKKTHPRIHFFSALDELNCRLGLARTGATNGATAALLLRLQKTLLCLSSPDNKTAEIRAGLRFLDGKTAALEKNLPALKHFLLPGASAQEAALHSARSACRSAELQAWGLPGCALCAIYLNRLSSCLFALARLSSSK